MFVSLKCLPNAVFVIKTHIIQQKLRKMLKTRNSINSVLVPNVAALELKKQWKVYMDFINCIFLFVFFCFVDVIKVNVSVFVLNFS